MWCAAEGRGEAGSTSTARLPDVDSLPSWLLPTFDEVFLSHDRPRFPRPTGHPWDTNHLNPAEAGGGVVIVSGRDVGVFKRRIKGERLAVDVWLAFAAEARDAAGARNAAALLGVYLGREAVTTIHVSP